MLVLAPILLFASLWVVGRAFWRFGRTGLAAARGIAFWIIVVCGLSFGSWLAFGLEYPVSAKMRVLGAPFPTAFFAWEGDRWTDFITPAFVMYPGILVNLLSPVVLGCLTLRWLSDFCRKA